MLFGHNPDLTGLASHLTGASIGNVPTCGVVSIRFPFRSWKKVGGKSGELVDFDYPKKPRDKETG